MARVRARSGSSGGRPRICATCLGCMVGWRRGGRAFLSCCILYVRFFWRITSLSSSKAFRSVNIVISTTMADLYNK